MRLTDKIALVTGASSGIGFAIAKRLSDEGAQLLITGRDPAKLQQACSDIGTRCQAQVCDSGKLADTAQLMKRIGADHGRIDVLVLNAGIARPAPLAGLDEESFDQLVAVNFKGVVFTIQQALPLLAPGASIIVLTSITNRLGSPGFLVYAACKAALASLVRSLALDLIKRGIRINAISPGPIDTPMFDSFGLDAAALSARKAAMAGKSPAGRFGRPEEIAGVAAFLASDDASYVIGEEIVVDGGMSLL